MPDLNYRNTNPGDLVQGKKTGSGKSAEDSVA